MPRPLAIILVVYAALLIVFHVEQRRSPFYSVPMADAETFDRLGRRLAEGHAEHPEFLHQAPLYPLLVGAVYRVAGPKPPAVYGLQALLALAALAFVFAAAREWFGPRAGVIAAALLAGYAPLLSSTTKLESTTLAIALGAAALWAVLARRAVWAGLFCGAAILVRPEMALFALFALWYLRSARFAGAAAIVLVALLARNWVTFGRPTLGASQAGVTFYTGNHAGAHGTYAAPPELSGGAAEQTSEERRAARKLLGHEPAEGEASHLFAHKALSWMATHPLTWIVLELQKAVRFVTADEPRLSFAVRDDLRWGQSMYLALIPFPLLFVLAMVVARSRKHLPLVAYGGVFLLTVLVFYMASRYRAPAAVAFAVMAAGGALQLGCNWRAWAVVGAATAILIPNFIDDAAARARSDSSGHHNAAVAWLRLGDVADGLAEIRTAEALFPSYSHELVLGDALARSGDKAAATAVWEKARDAHPNRAAAWLRLGKLREALQAEPDDPAARVALAQANSDQDQLRRVLADDPHEPGALIALAALCAANDGIDEARALYTRASIEAPTFWPVRHNLALLEERAGNRAAAERAYRAAIFADERAWPSHYNLGVLLLERGDLAGAREELRIAQRGGMPIDPRVLAKTGPL